MRIKDIFLPVVTANFNDTVEFYKRITGKEATLTASHDGYTLQLIEHFVILGSDDPKALEIPSLVNAIFQVDDLYAFWNVLQKEAKKVIVPVNRVSTGIRFIVEQQDGKVIEYLQLN